MVVGVFLEAFCGLGASPPCKDDTEEKCEMRGELEGEEVQREESRLRFLEPRFRLEKISSRTHPALLLGWRGSV